MIPSHLRVLFIELLERTFQRVRTRRRPAVALPAAAAVLGCLLNHSIPQAVAGPAGQCRSCYSRLTVERLRPMTVRYPIG